MPRRAHLRFVQRRPDLIARVLANGVEDNDVFFDEDTLALGLTLLIDVDADGRTTFLYALAGQPTVAFARSDVALGDALSVGVALANFDPPKVQAPAPVVVDNLRLLGPCP